MPMVVEGDLEWDSTKTASSLAKHGVPFLDAATAFADPTGVYLDDGSGTGNMVVIGASLRTSPVGRSREAGRTRSDAIGAERTVYDSGGWS
jgi:hypothetical protein